MRTNRRARPSPGVSLGALFLAAGLAGPGMPAAAADGTDDPLERPPLVQGTGMTEEAAASVQFPGPPMPVQGLHHRESPPAVRGDAAGYGGLSGNGERVAIMAPDERAADEDAFHEDDEDLPSLSAFGGRSRPGGCVNGALHISVCGPDMQAWQQSAEFALKDIWRRLSGQGPAIRTTARQALPKTRPGSSRDGWRVRVNRRVLMLNWESRF